MRPREQQPLAPPGRRGDEGLTLIEVVVAVAVLATLLSGIFAAMAHSMRADVLAREYAAASREAFAQIDLLTSDDLSAVIGVQRGFHVTFNTGATGSNNEVNLSPASGAQYSPHANLTGTTADESTMAGHVVVVADPDADGSDELAEIRVTITWRGADGRDQRIQTVCRRAK